MEAPGGGEGDGEEVAARHGQQHRVCWAPQAGKGFHFAKNVFQKEGKILPKCVKLSLIERLPFFLNNLFVN